MATISAAALTIGEIISINGEKLEVSRVRTVRPGRVRVETSDGQCFIFSNRAQIVTTGWRDR